MINPNGKLLLKWSHGLGDSVMLSIVLQHLHDHFPNLTIDIVANKDKHSCFKGLVRKCIEGPNENYDLKLDWWECDQTYPDLPATKTTKCLQEVFSITPTIKSYQIQISEDTRDKVNNYIATLPLPFVLIHYEGNTSPDRKNLDHSTVKRLCEFLKKHDYTPVIIDFDFRSPLPDNRTIFCPNRDNPLWGNTGTGDAATLAALIERAALFIGIDSGPLHVAQATMTPTIGCWTGHHPIHFSDLSGNITHLVPSNHAELIRGNRDIGLEFFVKNYDYRQYQTIDAELIRLVAERLGLPIVQGFASTSYAEDYYDEHARAGLDYLGYGDWQRNYGRWLVDVFELKGKHLVDLGCACGAICNGLQEAGAKCHGVDLNNHMIHLGKGKFRVESLNVCDSVNLHLFGDASLDFVHANQTFEHFKPELVPFILTEIRRVLKPGGVLFSVHDTAEFFAKHGRTVGDNGEVDGDPTHVCVKSNAWWEEQRKLAGFEDVRGHFEPLMRSHPNQMLDHYGWDFLVWASLDE